MKTQAGEETISLQLNVIKVSYKIVILIKIHLKTHAGENSYQCILCDKSFI